MAGTNISSSPKKVGKSFIIPTPKVDLGRNYYLQHNDGDSINTILSNTYISATLGAFTGADWANDTLKADIYYEPSGDLTEFFSRKPFVIMEILGAGITRKTTIKDGGGTKIKIKKQKLKFDWIHPPNEGGTLHRTGSNYGGGQGTMSSEWDFTPRRAHERLRIDIIPQRFYKNPPTLPIRYVEFFQSSHYLRALQGKAYGNGNGQGFVTAVQQPVVFMFGCIDDDGRSVIFSEPSDEYVLRLRGGYFGADDDHYFYDWELRKA